MPRDLRWIRTRLVPPAAIPGAYAWGVTVAPVAWGHPERAQATELAAIGALAFLAVDVVLERVIGLRARGLCLWAFVASCATTWAFGATANALPLEPNQVVAGVLGWAMFAFVWAAPPLRLRSEERLADRGDSPESAPPAALVSLALGIVLGVGMQVLPFGAKSPERMLLVRLLAVACALVAVDGAATIAVALFPMRRRRG
jgi:hypothetical protein